jgi:hypothetical protein
MNRYEVGMEYRYGGMRPLKGAYRSMVPDIWDRYEVNSCARV